MFNLGLHAIKLFNIKNNLIMLTRETFDCKSHGFDISMLYVLILIRGNKSLQIYYNILEKVGRWQTAVRHIIFRK